MKIITLNTTNNTKNTRKTPSFQSKLVASDEAKVILERGLLELYSNCSNDQKTKKMFFGDEKFDFKKIFARYKKAVEEETKGIDGDRGIIELSKKNFTNTPVLGYKTPDGNYLKNLDSIRVIWPIEILSYKEQNPENPMLLAVKTIVGKVADLMRDNGYGYGENNPFLGLYEKLNK